MPNDALVRVRIVDLPIDVMRRSRWHHDELLREFELIAHAGGRAAVPARLLELAAQLRDRYAAFTEEPTRALEDAAARGETLTSVDYDVPADIGPAARDLDAMLDEVDDFCRTGDLLTLATPPEVLRFRRWFLHEFARQTSGEPPLPWSPAS